MHSLYDAMPTAGRITDSGIRQLYTTDGRWQAWLDVEAALAEAEAEVGLVPEQAARVIVESAKLELMDRDRIAAATLRTSHTLVPLVWELSRVAGDEAGRWVHWGATTQNIVQTGDLLLLRRAHRIFLGLLDQTLLSMAELAERSADMTMPARTHGQHAVPTTFGFKVAVWIDEMARHLERLHEAEPRVFVAMLGGAAGTFASLGKQGRAVQAGVAARLGMAPMSVPARTIGDHLAEYVCLLGLLASTCGKIGREIYTLMKTEFGEVEEPIPPGTVGSSTMPQKRNPHLCQDIIAAAAAVRGSIPTALEAMQTEHEADRSTSLMMHEVVERACIATGDMLSRLAVIMDGLQLHPDRMHENVLRTNGLIMAEPVMLALGETIGRQTAHEVVYEAAQAAATEGVSFVDLLSKDARVTTHLSQERISSMLDPSGYVGLSPDLARESAARARRLADAARRGPSTE